MEFDELSAFEQAVRPAQRRQWEQLHAHCHEALIGVGTLPWTVKVQRMLWRHSERYRQTTTALPDPQRDVHAEDAQTCTLALSGLEARAALALEAHIRRTPDQLIGAPREGHIVLPSVDVPVVS